GNCTLFCPYSGRPYKDKLTLFWSEDDMEDSANQGFYMKPDGGFVFRLDDGSMFETVIDDKRVPAEIWSVVKAVISDHAFWVI
ncbi:MAG: hypothetical protein AB1Z19_00140, partial [Eubacteriales bacterium]